MLSETRMSGLRSLSVERRKRQGVKDYKTAKCLRC